MPFLNPLDFVKSQQQARQDNQPQGVFDKADAFLNKPSGQFLMNLLAQSGYSTMPGSPLGAVGRAGVMTQQQQQQQRMQELQRQLIESQIGINRSKAQGVGVDPLTEMGKVEADYRAGRISEAIRNAKVNELLQKEVNTRFANTQSLRKEFSDETQDIAKSMAALGSAASLIQTEENPIAQFAAFISTIKSIDNSTVREGELQAFQAVQGLRRQLEQQLNQAQGKGMTGDLRRDIAETIQKLQGPLLKLLENKRRFYESEASKNRLDPESVAGLPFSSGIDLTGFDADPGNPNKVQPSVGDDEIPEGKI